MKKKTLHIEIASVPWKKVKGLTRRLDRAAALTMACLPAPLLPAAQRAEATLLLTTDKKVQTLNRDFRGKDKPTNVLSFPCYARRELSRLGARGQEDLYVGDIAVAYAFTAAEARREGKTLLDHVTHLTIHGLLHLFGYDHDTPRKAAQMEKLEKEILATMGIPDPYAPSLFGKE